MFLENKAFLMASYRPIVKRYKKIAQNVSAASFSLKFMCFSLRYVQVSNVSKVPQSNDQNGISVHESGVLRFFNVAHSKYAT